MSGQYDDSVKCLPNDLVLILVVVVVVVSLITFGLCKVQVYLGWNLFCAQTTTTCLIFANQPDRQTGRQLASSLGSPVFPFRKVDEIYLLVVLVVK